MLLMIDRSRDVGGLKGSVVKTSTQTEEQLLTDDKQRHVFALIDRRKEGPIDLIDDRLRAETPGSSGPVDLIDRVDAVGPVHIPVMPSLIAGPGLRHKQISDAIGANIRNHFTGLGKRDANK